MATAHARPRLVAGAIAVTGALALAACGGTASGGAGGGAGSSEFSFVGLTSNQTPAKTLTALSTQTCADANTAAPLKADTVEQTSQDQKLQLLAGQDALPTAMIAPNTPSLVGQLIKNKQLVDLTKELDAAGLSDAVLPAAASTIEKLYGQENLYALPNEFNIEGIWYNKKIFADNGIEVPGTWDELVAATAKLKSAGVQPITADGKDGWPITRWVGAYLFRALGPDALQKVADGSAKLTDPDYVKAADAVSALGTAGAFGKNVASNDYNGTINDFLTGKSAMIYMGSWMLSNINDTSQNKIGEENIGFMPFPAVTGGAGSIDQIPANVGQPILLSQKSYGTNTAAWLKCIVTTYGDEVLETSGVISGFKLSEKHDLPPVTQVVQDQVSGAKSSVLWFEALFSAQATTVSQQQGGLLGRGDLSGADFMSKVQAAL
ncbi:extracellular solute-binding protein [Kineosporia sp. NBRC 101731]|uniref:ABC transporter substrate-binding protein n=1 Tax=Kineosporia sp. NBRC 101731 TaxID=3032199 RepID=UPI0024A1912B|nr:extracellular solute-binding protein [Kineosporia sp. NBRC 101731]GLY29742.1 ABC transporter substrate-binding protein [Kineosporia sp. NBRC 101731]